jgi:hypothetical protein
MGSSMIVGIEKMARVPLKPISQGRVLVVEGNDDAYLAEEVLTSLGHESNDFEIRRMIGDNSFRDLPILLKDPNFAIVRSLGIIWDADDDPDHAFQEIIELLRRNPALPIPNQPGTIVRNQEIAVGVYLVPGNGPGKLENLFLQSQATHSAMPCVDRYFECLTNVLPRKGTDIPRAPNPVYFPKDVLKARCLALLAAMHDTMPQIGIAAQKHYWNLNHECLTSLKTFLKEWMRVGA